MSCIPSFNMIFVKYLNYFKKIPQNLIEIPNERLRLNQI